MPPRAVRLKSLPEIIPASPSLSSASAAPTASAHRSSALMPSSSPTPLGAGRRGSERRGGADGRQRDMSGEGEGDGGHEEEFRYLRRVSNQQHGATWLFHDVIAALQSSSVFQLPATSSNRNPPWAVPHSPTQAALSVLPSALFSVLHCLATGQLLALVTHHAFTARHTLVAAALAEGVFALLGGVPATAAAPSVLVAALMGGLYRLTAALRLPFLPWAGWVGLWAFVCLLLAAAANACRLADQWSAATWRVEGALTSGVLFVGGVQMGAECFRQAGAVEGGEGGEAVAFATVCVAGAGVIIALWLRRAATWHFFSGYIRGSLAHYAPILGFLASAVLLAVPPFLHLPLLLSFQLPLPLLSPPPHIPPIAWGSHLGGVTVGAAVAAAVPGAVLAALLFLAHNTAALTQEAYTFLSAYHPSCLWDSTTHSHHPPFTPLPSHTISPISRHLSHLTPSLPSHAISPISRHLSRLTPSLPSHAISPVSRHLSRLTPSLPSHAISPISRHLSHLTPSLPSHAISPISRHLSHLTPSLPSHAISPVSRHLSHLTPALPSLAISPTSRHLSHLTPSLPSHAISPVSRHLSRLTPSLPSHAIAPISRHLSHLTPSLPSHAISPISRHLSPLTPSLPSHAISPVSRHLSRLTPSLPSHAISPISRHRSHLSPSLPSHAISPISRHLSPLTPSLPSHAISPVSRHLSHLTPSFPSHAISPISRHLSHLTPALPSLAISPTSRHLSHLTPSLPSHAISPVSRHLSHLTPALPSHAISPISRHLSHLTPALPSLAISPTSRHLSHLTPSLPSHAISPLSHLSPSLPSHTISPVSRHLSRLTPSLPSHAIAPISRHLSHLTPSLPSHAISPISRHLSPLTPSLPSHAISPLSRHLSRLTPSLPSHAISPVSRHLSHLTPSLRSHAISSMPAPQAEVWGDEMEGEGVGCEGGCGRVSVREWDLCVTAAVAALCLLLGLPPPIRIPYLSSIRLSYLLKHAPKPWSQERLADSHLTLSRGQTPRHAAMPVAESDSMLVPLSPAAQGKSSAPASAIESAAHAPPHATPSCPPHSHRLPLAPPLAALVCEWRTVGGLLAALLALLALPSTPARLLTLVPVAPVIGTCIAISVLLVPPSLHLHILLSLAHPSRRPSFPPLPPSALPFLRRLTTLECFSACLLLGWSYLPSLGPSFPLPLLLLALLLNPFLLRLLPPSPRSLLSPPLLPCAATRKGSGFSSRGSVINSSSGSSSSSSSSARWQQEVGRGCGSEGGDGSHGSWDAGDGTDGRVEEKGSESADGEWRRRGVKRRSRGEGQEGDMEAVQCRQMQGHEGGDGHAHRSPNAGLQSAVAMHVGMHVGMAAAWGAHDTSSDGHDPHARLHHPRYPLDRPSPFLRQPFEPELSARGRARVDGECMGGGVPVVDALDGEDADEEGGGGKGDEEEGGEREEVERELEDIAEKGAQQLEGEERTPSDAGATPSLPPPSLPPSSLPPPSLPPQSLPPPSLPPPSVPPPFFPPPPVPPPSVPPVTVHSSALFSPATIIAALAGSSSTRGRGNGKGGGGASEGWEGKEGGGTRRVKRRGIGAEKGGKDGGWAGWWDAGVERDGHGYVNGDVRGDTKGELEGGVHAAADSGRLTEALKGKKAMDGGTRAADIGARFRGLLQKGREDDGGMGGTVAVERSEESEVDEEDEGHLESEEEQEETGEEDGEGGDEVEGGPSDWTGTTGTGMSEGEEGAGEASEGEEDGGWSAGERKP
ncbi:hypothetical protein CLOP_g9368 [Closterium sp. NIES-67]|nr:hypothetical protein CLOP_g9368 [Closterium sp. NIES-67]